MHRFAAAFLPAVVSFAQEAVVSPAQQTAAPQAGESAAAGPVFDVHALLSLARISDPRLSPDGAQVAYAVERVSEEENTKSKQIFAVSTDGGEARQLTHEGNNSRPRWSPDSTRIAFVSDRAESSQIWMMAADGSGQRPVTDIPTGADGVLFSPAGDTLVFGSRVYPQCGGDWECNRAELEQAKGGPVKARVYDSLLYRHWDAWDDGRRSHLFAVAADASPGNGAAPVDLTPGEYDAPPFSLSAPKGYAISPDGLEVAYVRASDEAAESGLAVSTGADLFAVPIEGGEPVRLTDNPAFDGGPVYSPDGLYIAYIAQQRAGYESDRFRLMLYDRESGETAAVTETFDRWVTSVSWSSDSSRLFLTADDRGREPIFTVLVSGGGVHTAVYGDAAHGDVQLLPDGKSLIYTAQSGSHPVEIFRGFASGGAPLRLTHENDAALARHTLPDYEEIRYASRDGSEVSGFLLKPADLDLDGSYPLLLLIHGGPQGAWRQSWSYRWNAQVFAAAGFVVFMPNPRGSTGYGQAFIDGINGDWGGKVVEDILAGLDTVIPRPYIDRQRVVAAGGSYGGYMVNWLLGHSDRFRALVSHAGVYDLKSFFGATEELWFPLWEFGGAPWEKPEMYEKWSPSAAAAKFRTPTLVIHGQKDYRVPVEQGMALFTALQMQDVPSRFLYYPDEGHWILKPANSVLWYDTVLGWLRQWVHE